MKKTFTLLLSLALLIFLFSILASCDLSKPTDCLEYKANDDLVSYSVVGMGTAMGGTNAFSNCTNLSEIILPNSVTEIGTNAFFRMHFVGAHRLWLFSQKNQY